MSILDNLPMNEEGYLTDPSAWNEEVAKALAEQEGIALTEQHWEVIRWCRTTAAESGKAPTLRQITSGTGLSTKELFTLFPKGPAKKVARTAKKDVALARKTVKAVKADVAKTKKTVKADVAKAKRAIRKAQDTVSSTLGTIEKKVAEAAEACPVDAIIIE